MKERVPLRRSKHLPQRAAVAEVTRKRRVRAQVEMRMQFRAQLFNEVPERDHRRWSLATKGHHLSELTEFGRKWPHVANAEMYFKPGTEFAFLAIIGLAAIA